jgi:hypothetical protein
MNENLIYAICAFLAVKAYEEIFGVGRRMVSELSLIREMLAAQAVRNEKYDRLHDDFYKVKGALNQGKRS